jgi:4-carboxymuconolactone decarboxylase
MKKSERWEKGAAKMKQLFGREPAPGDMDPDFQKITVENLFGDIWNRPGLELRERSMITVAALTVLGRWPELKIHLRGALNAGISRETINEMMIHLAHYGGWPVGVSGWHTAKEVFGEIDNQNKK